MALRGFDEARMRGTGLALVVAGFISGGAGGGDEATVDQSMPEVAAAVTGGLFEASALRL